MVINAYMQIDLNTKHLYLHTKNQKKKKVDI